MHRAIEDGFEDFLAGAADRETTTRIEAHLQQCADCREEVQAMREMSELLTALRTPDPPQPDPGFYARVNLLIEKQQPVPFWAAALEPFFGKRLALASLLAMAALGTVLVSRETQNVASQSAEMVLANETAAPEAGPGPAINRAQALYTLVSSR